MAECRQLARPIRAILEEVCSAIADFSAEPGGYVDALDMQSHSCLAHAFLVRGVGLDRIVREGAPPGAP